MDITEAQQKVLKLVRLAASAPDTEEARTAAVTACRFISEHGLLIMKPSDLVQAPFIPPPPVPAPAVETSGTKKRRKRASSKTIRETMTTAAETASTAAETAAAALDAGSRVARAFNGFRNAIRGSGA